MSTDAARPDPVLLFDGECGLCQRLVRVLLGLDRRGRLRFAPLQGPAAQSYLRQHGSARDRFRKHDPGAGLGPARCRPALAANRRRDRRVARGRRHRARDGGGCSGWCRGRGATRATGWWRGGAGGSSARREPGRWRGRNGPGGSSTRSLSKPLDRSADLAHSYRRRKANRRDRQTPKTAARRRPRRFRNGLEDAPSPPVLFLISFAAFRAGARSPGPRWPARLPITPSEKVVEMSSQVARSILTPMNRG
jgi:hypothetical protein